MVDGRRVLSLSSNNYLGLANHPALIEAAVAAARELGVGAGASRLISGSMRLHHELEERLAAFKGAEACLLFPSGYQANLGVISAWSARATPSSATRSTTPASSTAAACRAPRVRVYPHGDVAALEERLRRARGAPPADRHRLGLQHGRRRRAARPRSATWPSATTPW